ncbi:hypothetical protein EZV62_010346 [Acer yangbiense]|uniref:Di19 C-terminal domain-containing protein n=1 Tax=Acer yangbiense TaxID=1000413 RepID=A0A5C7I4G3_9ROSI|nr:hypothetical protein EZV62_010346 [Acer yangbiense]
MDYDTYFGLSTLSRNYQSTLKSQFADICIDFEDIEDDDEEMRGDFFCPLCSEDFDLVGLCCHIEADHPIEAKSSSSVSSSKMAPDPLLSFIYNMAPDVSESVQPDSTIREKAEEKSSYEKASETNVHLSSLPDKDHPEKAKRCEFVQGLIMSTIFDDDGL